MIFWACSIITDDVVEFDVLEQVHCNLMSNCVAHKVLGIHVDLWMRIYTKLDLIKIFTIIYRRQYNTRR